MTTGQELLNNKVTYYTYKMQHFHELYWKKYSFLDHWQFWVNIIFLIVPLICLYFLLDRKNNFQMLFFGFIIHVLMNYIDITAVLKVYVEHLYPIIPVSMVNLSINTSLIPALYLLTYQYGVNKGKNIFLLGLIVSAFTGLFLGTLNQDLGMLRLLKTMNIWILSVTNYIEFLIAYGLTSLFLFFSKAETLLLRK